MFFQTYQEKFSFCETISKQGLSCDTNLYKAIYYQPVCMLEKTLHLCCVSDYIHEVRYVCMYFIDQVSHFKVESIASV
jgi:hypothetical protein